MRRWFPTMFVIVVSCVAASAAHAAGPPPGSTVETRTEADSVAVGERIHVTYTAVFPDSLTLVTPDGFNAGTCRVMSIRWRDGSQDGKRTRTADVTAITLDLERASIPPVRFLFTSAAGDSFVLFSDEVDIPVRQLTQAQSEPKPLKPQWDAPRTYMWLIAAAALVVLAAIALYLFRRWRKRRVVAEPVKPALPADFVALKELQRIEELGLLEKSEFKRYYTLVVDAIRVYLERRYGVQAMDRTTYEILWDLEGRRVEVDGLEALLSEADLVKFAKHVPDAAAGKQAMEAARDMIVRTAPRPVVEATQAASAPE